jgi:hypothetical protein
MKSSSTTQQTRTSVYRGVGDNRSRVTTIVELINCAKSIVETWHNTVTLRVTPKNLFVQKIHDGANDLPGVRR